MEAVRFWLAGCCGVRVVERCGACGLFPFGAGACFDNSSSASFSLRNGSLNESVFSETTFGFRNVGDCPALSIPASSPQVIIDVPPCEIKGIVTPVNGIRLQEPKMFKPICTTKTAATPRIIVVW